MEQTGWLIEEVKSGYWLSITGGSVYWTSDAFDAIRFARREDAERTAISLLGLFDVDKRPYSVHEHSFE